MLYSDEFIDGLPELTPFENPWVVGICKMEHGGETRAMIERWYRELPDDLKARFATKLQSLDNNIFIAAFHELAIYRYCTEEGWEVEYEPQLDNGLTPDLMVHSNEFGDFTIEVTTLFDTAELAKAVARREALTRFIAAIDTDFILSIDYKSYPIASYKPRVIANIVKRWLDSLPQDNRKHVREFNLFGCQFEVEADRRAPKPNMGSVLAVMDGGSVPDYSDRAKRKLDEKRRKYSSKELGIPLIVVLADGVGRMRVDSYLVDRTLFGQYQVTFSVDGSQPAQMGRDRSGHFTPSNDASGEWFGQNTGVSGVMFSSFSGGAKFQMKLFHNPVSAIPIPYGAFKKMPQLIRTDERPDIKMRWTLGEPDNFIEDDDGHFITFQEEP